MSTEQKSFSLAEVREKERRAFVEGAFWMRDLPWPGTSRGAAHAAGERYPRPAKRRVVIDCDDANVHWTVQDGEIVGRHSSDQDGRWINVNDFMTSAARIHLWADLLANPEEPCNE